MRFLPTLTRGNSHVPLNAHDTHISARVRKTEKTDFRPLAPAPPQRSPRSLITNAAAQLKPDLISP